MPSDLVRAGTPIPGVARNQFSATLRWRGEHWTLSGQGLGVGHVSVNDLGSDRSPGYALLAVEAGRTWKYEHGSLHAFTRIENALDQRYIGSVIINEGNGRYYEPGADRTLTAGAQWRWE